MTNRDKELEELKKEYSVLSNKLKELTSDELKEVVGGIDLFVKDSENYSSNQKDFSDLGKFDVQKKFDISEEKLEHAK